MSAYSYQKYFIDNNNNIRERWEGQVHIIISTYTENHFLQNKQTNPNYNQRHDL